MNTKGRTGEKEKKSPRELFIEALGRGIIIELRMNLDESPRVQYFFWWWFALVFIIDFNISRLNNSFSWQYANWKRKLFMFLVYFVTFYLLWCKPVWPETKFIISEKWSQKTFFSALIGCDVYFDRSHQSPGIAQSSSIRHDGQKTTDIDGAHQLGPPPSSDVFTQISVWLEVGFSLVCYSR